MGPYTQDELEDMLLASPERAIVLLEELARQGNADALYVLGMAYYDGDGVKPDALKCADLLAQAMALGHVKASHDLGCFHYYGYGFPEGFRNLEKSAELLARTVQQGYIPSMTFLGNMYERGEGVPQSLGKAKALYERAAQLGDEMGELGLKRLAQKQAGNT